MIKRILAVFFTSLALVLLNSNVISAVSFADDVQYPSYDHYFKDYDISIDVQENGDLQVTERIDAFFNQQRHGIYRTIPTRNTFYYDDGTVSRRASLKNISVEGHEYTVESTSDGKKIKIGSASNFVFGDQTYVIHYTYNLGKDKFKDFDDLYYNLIGTEATEPIEHVSFAINMPKAFDESKVAMWSGQMRSKEDSRVEYQVSDNSIRGETTSVLMPGEALTVRVVMEDGYFAFKEVYEEHPEYMLLYAIPIAGLVICWLLWAMFGNDQINEAPAAMYPPEGLSCPEIALVRKRKVVTDDVMAMLFSLADRGYLRIVDNPEKSSDFNIVRVKLYDGDNELERMFMDGLFKNATVVGTAGGFSAVNESDGTELADGGEAIIEAKKLHNKFYRVVNQIIRKANSNEFKQKYYEKNTALPTAVAVLFSIACIACIGLALILGDTQSMPMFIAAIVLALVYIPAFVSALRNKGVAKIVTCAFLLIHASLFIIPFYVMLSVISVDIDDFFIGAVIVGVIGAIGCILAVIYMPKLTPYGAECFAHIESFRKNIAATVGSNLSTMSAPEMPYAYAILPYAFMFGMTAKWMKKFSEVARSEPPTWYSTSNHSDFSPTSFNHLVTRGMGTITSAPSSSGSSGGSSGGGGGCSGGGGGGGGSGSW